MATLTTHAATREAGAGDSWRGDDFADWLPPMLVRELRQGLDSGAFFWTFVLLQLALVMHAVFTFLYAAGGSDGTVIRASGGFLWAILVIVVGFVIPLRGLTAISAERAGNNLDLVRLTRLSATRIVVGKWAAIVAQVLLVTVAVLPYLVLRYFMGGVNVVGDLSRLGWLVVAATLVAALAVYASTRPPRERVGMVVLAVFGGQAAITGLSAVTGRPAWAGAVAGDGWFRVGIAGLYAALILEAAAASIAPASENHAVRKRFFGFGCAAVIAAAGLVGRRADFAVVALAFGLPVLFLVVGALCERPVRFRRLHAAFSRGGAAGRAAAAVLTPGWATGLVFLALAGGLTAVGFLAASGNSHLMQACVGLVAAAIVYPLPLLLLLRQFEAPRATLYVAVQFICLVVLAGDLMLHPVAASASPELVAPFPLAGLLRLVGPGGHDAGYVTTLYLAGLVVLAVILVIVARPWWREMRETWRLVGARAPS